MRLSSTIRSYIKPAARLLLFHSSHSSVPSFSRHTHHPPLPLFLSHVKGPTTTPLIEKTVGDFWDAQVERYGDRLALVVKHERDLRWTFREFGDQVDALARGLWSSGLRRGDRVGVFMHNNSAWATLQYACAKVGIILTTINPGYRASELESALKLVGCRSLITTLGFKSSNYLEMIQDIFGSNALEKGVPGALHSDKLPDLKHIVFFDNGARNIDEMPKGAINYADLLQRYPTDATTDPVKVVPPFLRNSDIMNIQFTSGTTGKPKGVSLSHRNILNNGVTIGDRMKLTEKDKLCIPVPLFHCFGLVLGNLAAMTHGASVVYPSEGFHAESVLRAVSEERCTALHGVPTMFIAEMNHPNFKDYDLKSLRTGIAAGSSVPIETMKNIIVKMNMREITICYGMTETSPVSFQSHTTDDLTHRCETVGRVFDHVEAKVVDPVTGETLPVGQAGELYTRGYIVMMGGYWGSEAQTKEAVDVDGWMHTGDTAIIDHDGYARIVGRIKDIIIRGGENIHPVEIENVLFTHPHIENVSVVGVPDEIYGEQVCAWVIPKSPDSTPHVTTEALRSFLQDRISHHKIPKYVIVIHDKDNGFPKTGSGKIQKHILRERSRKHLGV